MVGGNLKIQTKTKNPASGKELTYARDCTEMSDEALFNCTTKNFNGNVGNFKKYVFCILLFNFGLLWSIFIFIH